MIVYTFLSSLNFVFVGKFIYKGSSRKRYEHYVVVFCVWWYVGGEGYFVRSDQENEFKNMIPQYLLASYKQLAGCSDNLKGTGGGVQPKILDFLPFEICCSPTFLVSKMGSFVSQFKTLAEIQPLA